MYGNEKRDQLTSLKTSLTLSLTLIRYLTLHNIYNFKMESTSTHSKGLSRAIFIESLVGNIKEKYFFEKKLGSGGYGAVYLAKNKLTGKFTN